MPKWITVAFTLLLSFHVFSTQAKTVDEVIDNYISATTGKAAMPEDKAGISQPVQILSPFLLYPVKRVLAPFSKAVTVPESTASLHAAAAPEEPALVNYMAKGHKAVLAGQENRMGRACYKVLLTLRSGQQQEYYIDAASWQIMESRSVVP